MASTSKKRKVLTLEERIQVIKLLESGQDETVFFNAIEPVLSKHLSQASDFALSLGRLLKTGLTVSGPFIIIKIIYMG